MRTPKVPGMTPAQEMAAAVESVRSTVISLQMTEKSLAAMIDTEVVNATSDWPVEVRAAYAVAAKQGLFLEICRHFCRFVYVVDGREMSGDEVLAADLNPDQYRCGFIWKDGEPFTELMTSSERAEAVFGVKGMLH